jgi:SAM-dependent methyltransferase
VSTDAEWEDWGRREPYFGVITDPKYRKANITDEALREFFDSGRAHVQYLIDMIHLHIDANFRARSVLDFGCGVGRQLVAFAGLADDVLGVDVSPSMLAEARANCDARGASAVRLLRCDDTLGGVPGAFDLVHSYIVFQHIPPERGRAIFGALLPLVAPGGVGAVHFAYSKSRYAATHGVAPPPEPSAPPAPPPAGSPPPDPEMQMNPYPMNEVLFLMQRAGIHRFHAEFTDHGGELGVFLFFQKLAG